MPTEDDLFDDDASPSTTTRGTIANTQDTTSFDDVDWENMTIETAEPEKDYNDIPPPPPAGRYNANLVLDVSKNDPPFLEEGIHRKKNKKGQWYLFAYLTVRIDDPGQPWHGAVCRPDNYFMTTTSGRDGGTSGLADICNKIGKPLAKVEGFLGLMNSLRANFSTEPSIRVEIDWEAGRSLRDGEKPQRKGSEWVTLAKGMGLFPTDKETGQVQNFIVDKEDGQQYYAMAKVTKFLNPTE